MLTDEQVLKYIFTRVTQRIEVNNTARWIDQKCTFDVLCVVSDCILDLSKRTGQLTLTNKDVWRAKFSEETVGKLYKKPNVNDENAKGEYNKFFEMQMELLSFAGILQKEKIKRTNYYTIKEPEILEYLAIREQNCIKFLATYIEKVLRNSNIYDVFDAFFRSQNNESYHRMKDSFTDFILANSRINGVTEIRRIFIKVLNPLAYVKNKKGTEKGRMSKDVCSFGMILYNQKNFRDIYSSKPKDLTRKVYEMSEAFYESNPDRTYYSVDRSKRYVKEYNQAYNAGMSELAEDSNNEFAANVHHIFPVSSKPILSTVLENLICITPSQHFLHAHPNNNTARIDERYQIKLLLAKLDTIEKDYKINKMFYDFHRFIDVLTIGFDDLSFKDIEYLNFDKVRAALIKKYADLMMH